MEKAMQQRITRDEIEGRQVGGAGSIHWSTHHTRRRDAPMAQRQERQQQQQRRRAHKQQVKEAQQLEMQTRSGTAGARRFWAYAALVAGALCLAAAAGTCAAEETGAAKPAEARATQASIDRQLDTPAASAAAVSPSSSASSGKPTPAKAARPQPSSSTASQKRAAAASLASATSYDKYQLKASPSAHSAAAAATAAPKTDKSETSGAEGAKAEAGAAPAAGSVAHKKAGQPQKMKLHSFALLKKLLPSFMTSAAAAAAAAGVAGAADRPQAAGQHSRSSGPSTSSGALFAHLTGEGPLSYASGKLVNLLAGGAKKRVPLSAEASAIPNHAPFFVRKAAVDRQAGGGAMALASGLLSNPLKLGLLFSAPLLPSLLLTPLAIAGLSPAMSAINNFFGDDDEPAAQQSSSPLAALAGGPNSPLANILQATGGSQSSDSASSANSLTGAGGAPPAGSKLALQAFQSLLLGPSSTTERPLFNPGMFASSGIGNAMGSLASSVNQATGGGGGGGGGGASSSSSQSRPIFGGGLIQTAASMISPSFAAPPSASGSSNSGSSSSSSGDEDGPGIMQMASDVFEKVANYMGGEGGNKDIAQASGQSALGPAPNSPLSTLAGLSSLSPFQLSNLFAPTAFGSAIGHTHSGHSGHSGHASAAGSGGPQKAGFLATLRNVYELFSSSFLRRQEVGDSNECQQRLVCELHQRAMGSKLFRRSLQNNLLELANLDRNLLEQLKFASPSLQARVDPDTRAMLADFLKAANSFKGGRELVNCGQMFPKCSRAQLLAAANAHLNDPSNGRTIGKFGQLMKKMKFKAAQQHQSQWKARKPSTKLAAPAPPTPAPLDYLQVAPLAGQPGQAALAPVDSLKLAQQLMLLSQLNQPQAQQQQMSTMAGSQLAVQPQQQLQQQQPQQQQPQQQQQQQQQQQAQQPYRSNQYAQHQASSQAPQSSFAPQNSYPSQYSPAPAARQTTYTDAVLPPAQPYATESPYFAAGQQSGWSGPQQAQQMDVFAQAQQAQQNQYQSAYQNYAPASPVGSDQAQQQQQQQPQSQQSQQSQQSAAMEGAKQAQQQQPMAQQSAGAKSVALAA